MEILDREYVKTLHDDYLEILQNESHTNHELINDNGRVRWKEDPEVSEMIERIGLNQVIQLYISLGYTKNSEEWRHLYRSIGYSLGGYWEVFYWDTNNSEVDNYKK
jgi:hypothetical protein